MILENKKTLLKIFIFFAPFVFILLNTKIKRVESNSDSLVLSKTNLLDLKTEKFLSIKKDFSLKEGEILVKVNAYSLSQNSEKGNLFCENFSGKVFKSLHNSSFQPQDRVFGKLEGNQKCEEYIKIKESDLDIHENPYISITDTQTVSLLYAFNKIQFILNQIEKITENKKNKRKYKILIDNGFSEFGTIIVGLLKDKKNITITALEDNPENIEVLKKLIPDVINSKDLNLLNIKFDYIYHIYPDLKIDILFKFLKRNGKIINLTNEQIENSKVFNFNNNNTLNINKLNDIFRIFNSGRVLLYQELQFNSKNYKKLFDFYKNRLSKDGYITFVFE